jgi:uncharacterized protein
MINVINDLVMTVLGYLKADWLILLIGILFAVSINVYIDPDKLRRFLSRKEGVSIPGSIMLGTFTPLCACGTMAVLISMFVSAMPWGPVMAFLVSSPLTSPSEYMFETAFFGSRFATAMLISSLALGLLAGFSAFILDRKTSFFKGQFRLAKENQKTCCTKDKETQKENDTCCSSREIVVETNLCCTEEKVQNTCAGFLQRVKLDKFAKEFINIGVKKVLLYFIIFIAIGRLAEMIIPKEWIISLFSGDNSYSIPLAATIGLPLYINDSSALPLLKSFMNSGAGEGAVLAFLIAGKATGIPVVAGMSTFLKKRAMIYYVGIVYTGAILAGYIYQIFVSL